MTAQQEKQADGYQPVTMPHDCAYLTVWGCRDTINDRRCNKMKAKFGRRIKMKRIEKLQYEIDTADAVVVGAGAGISASSGLHYDRERFEKYFQDLQDQY